MFQVRGQKKVEIVTPPPEPEAEAEDGPAEQDDLLRSDSTAQQSDWV